jgi:hypothetical protein
MTDKPALQADLHVFHPADVLQTLSISLATGCAVFRRGEHVTEVWVERGKPVFARTSAPALRIGDILVQRGVVSAEALEDAIAIQRAGSWSERLGAILVAAGQITPEELNQAVDECLRRILYALFLWREGDVEFFAGGQSEFQDVRTELELGRLILESLTLQDENRGE